MDGPVSFGEWLRRRREALHLSRPELARRASCSVPALRKIEIGERRPSPQLAELLAAAVGLPPADHPTFVRVARGELNLERLPAAAPTAAQEFRSPPAPAGPAHEIPVPVTPLVGRESELAALARLLDDPHCRLLTVTGPGGIGKTRLATEAALGRRAVQATFFLALAPLSSPEFIAPAIADALGFKFAGPADPTSQLVRYLRDRSLLLVLDNFEHLLDGHGDNGSSVACALVAAILQGAHGAHLLVTSRERLELQGEWVFDLHGLPVPPAGAPTTGDSGSSAVALFVQSARRARAAFEPQPDDWPALARICRLVAGVPLAVELAAAWVPMLSCAEIAREIEQSLTSDANLDFLATSLRDVPERHRSMRTVIDHSWQRLSDGEQRALRQLAIFRGGFSREAAERVAGAPLALLSALVTKSLVQRAGPARYDLHELVRQYAAARLAAETSEEPGTCARHCLHYFGLLEEGGDLNSRPKHTLAELLVDMSNIRLAWEWATAHFDSARLCQASITLWYLFELPSAFVEGEIVFRRAAETLERRAQAGDADLAGLTVALNLMRAHQAYFQVRLGRLEQAYPSLLAARANVLASADPYPPIVVAWYLGLVCYALGRFDESHVYFEECLTSSRAYGKRLHEAWGLEWVGIVAHEQGAYERAAGYLAGALAISRQVGDALQTSHILYFCGRTANRLGDYAQAEALLQEGLALARQVGYPTGVAVALYGIAMVAQARGDAHEANARYEASYPVFRQIGEVRGHARALNHQGLNWLALGESGRAKECLSAALRLAHECGSTPVILETLASLAALQAENGAGDTARELVAAVLAHPACTQDARSVALRASAQLQPEAAAGPAGEAEQRASARDVNTLVGEALAGAT
jgi:predicted ATPase/transcriptional regulator with XRE-family HTH domain